MLIEMLRYECVTLANHHGLIPMLNPEKGGGFDRTPHGDLVAKVYGVIAASPQVLGTSVRDDPSVGEITAPIERPDGEGWGLSTAPAVADALLRESNGAIHWLAMNRSTQSRDVDLHLGDLGVTVADVSALQFYTTATLQDPPFEGTLDLIAPPVEDVVAHQLTDGVVLMSATSSL